MSVIVALFVCQNLGVFINNCIYVIAMNVVSRIWNLQPLIWKQNWNHNINQTLSVDRPLSSGVNCRSASVVLLMIMYMQYSFIPDIEMEFSIKAVIPWTIKFILKTKILSNSNKWVRSIFQYTLNMKCRKFKYLTFVIVVCAILHWMWNVCTLVI